ncbi:heat shock protein beta-6 [Esox lucius]|uniref:SHSP domain-containing protein n=1 Tax=Esox lucius TaxID=8010 RepID=A0AAY5K083_ESOLU|nr:heat shock protein beta-6 [Esox lucius]
MDFNLPSTCPVRGIQWERVLPPLLQRLKGTFTPSELLIPVTEHSGEVFCDHTRFSVQVDVKPFKPDELTVKVIGDFVEVQGKHEQKKDGSGVVTRQFNSRFRIPEKIDTMALESDVSSEGILIISAPLLQGENPRPLSHSEL